MKIGLKKTTWRALGGVIASLFLAVSFQNCGKAGFDSSLDDSLTSASSDAALSAKYGQATGALVSAIPFAFDGGFDQFTYNSCADSSLTGQPAYFSVKVGSYYGMGLKLNADFFNYVNSNFKPTYGNTSISQDQYTNYLGDSPQNKGAIADFSIRSKSNLYNVYTTANQVTMGQDVIGLINPLTDANIATTLVSSSNYLNFFPFSSDNRAVEATLTFNSSTGTAESWRQMLSGGDGMLSMTYLQSSSDPNNIRAATAANPLKSAYGRGYKLSFTQPPTANATSARVLPSNLVGSVMEVDLNTGQATGSNWNCSRRYLVVRSQDKATFCPTLTDAQLADTSIRQELAIARKHLHADQWDVNPVGVGTPCVVPRVQTSCYKEETNPTTGAAYGVNYYPGGDPSMAGQPEGVGECFNDLLQAGNYSTAAIPNKRCANYITICVRN
ncbi:MAG TPA: hypothetical protein VN132_01795 [Bdellovibrio sp.]|nr:hypothetical protein [Bdellovibrio sp.]